MYNGEVVYKYNIWSNVQLGPNVLLAERIEWEDSGLDEDDPDYIDYLIWIDQLFTIITDKFIIQLRRSFYLDDWLRFQDMSTDVRIMPKTKKGHKTERYYITD